MSIKIQPVTAPPPADSPEAQVPGRSLQDRWNSHWDSQADQNRIRRGKRDESRTLPTPAMWLLPALASETHDLPAAAGGQVPPQGALPAGEPAARLQAARTIEGSNPAEPHGPLVVTASPTSLSPADIVDAAASRLSRAEGPVRGEEADGQKPMPADASADQADGPARPLGGYPGTSAREAALQGSGAHKDAGSASSSPRTPVAPPPHPEARGLHRTLTVPLTLQGSDHQVTAHWSSGASQAQSLFIRTDSVDVQRAVHAAVSSGLLPQGGQWQVDTLDAAGRNDPSTADGGREHDADAEREHDQ